MKKWFALLLSLCLMLSCLPVVAQEQVPVIVPEETVSLQATQLSHVAEYDFTPQTSGMYVFYDVEEGANPSTLTVVDSTAPDLLLAQGAGRVCFQAQAGVTYRLYADCEWSEGSGIAYSFRLDKPAQAEEITIRNVTLVEGFAGDSGSVTLGYQPFHATAEIQWSSTNPQVVTVTGDQNGAQYTLVGEGVAEIVATTADGKTARLAITVKSMDVLTVATPVVHTIEGSGGRYAGSEHTFRFTPEESGTYALSVRFDENLEFYHDLQMSMVSAGGYLYSADVLRFDAVAGDTYELDVEFWGMYDESVEYEFVIQPCVPGEKIQLTCAKDVGYVGGSLLVQVKWEPINSLLKELTWTSSDPAVAQITAPTWEFATVEFLSAGQVTITAATQDGLVAELALTVYDAPYTIVLEENKANWLMLLGGGYTDISFTPTVTGYYNLISDNAFLGASLFASSSNKDGVKLYYMEAGKTYYGGVDNYSDGIATGDIYIIQEQIQLPVSMKITKQPGNTVYLKDSLKDMWTYQILAGLEMEIYWSDGTTTRWRFDEEGPYIGQEYLDWELNTDSDGKGAKLLLRCGDATAECSLSLLDKTVTGISLLDNSPLEIVEKSCGMDMGDGTWYYSSYLSGMRWVRIHFSDGSISTLRPDQQLYGYYVTCGDNQMDTPWSKDSQGTVTYGYMNETVELEVRIIDSPVEKIELVQKPVDTFIIGDPNFFSGVDAYYFAPDSMRDFLEGLSIKIFYADGTDKTVAFEDLKWEKIMGVEHPCVDGYPLGLFSDLITGNDLIESPCEKVGIVEYKGASVTYPIYLVEGELPQDPPDHIDPPDPSVPTDPTKPSGTEDPSVPTDPSQVTDPTAPSDATTKPTEQTQKPTEPSRTPDSDEDDALAGWQIALIVICVAVFVAGGVCGWLWWKKHRK